MVTADHPRSRAPRKDALANRERILTHAERVFADEGFSVSLHRIAEDLGIGIGTVYRHFPTHGDLLVGIYRRFEAKIDAAGGRIDELPDPFERIVAFIDVTVELSFASPIARTVAREVRRYLPDEPAPSWVAGMLSDAVAEARENGDLRHDVGAGDIAILAGMLADLVHQPEPQRALALARMRPLALDAIRPAGAPREDLPDTAATSQDIVDMLHGRTQPVLPQT
jgi:AcrR family transcriptional regulator